MQTARFIEWLPQANVSLMQKGLGILFYESVTYLDYPSRTGSDIRIVGNENDGLSLGMEAFENREDFRTGFRIESSRRLVGENDGRISNDCPGNRHALLLSAGKFVRTVPGFLGKSDAFERGKRPFPPLRLPYSLIRERKHDLFQGGKSRDEVVALKNESDLLSAKLGLFVSRKFFYGNSVEFVFSRRRGVEYAYDVHEGRFSGTRRSHDGNELPFLDAERNALENLEVLQSHAVRFRYVSKYEHLVCGEWRITFPAAVRPYPLLPRRRIWRTKTRKSQKNGSCFRRRARSRKISRRW